MSPSGSATRAETIADDIRQAIRAGRFVSGERLREMSLAQEMGVSQNTIRDALNILQNEGWVVKHARHGAYVRSFSADEADELYALWAAVESLALRWVVQAATRGQLSGLRRLVEKARTQALMGQTQAATDLLFSLHANLANLSGKAQTAALLTSLHNRAYLLELLRQMRAPRSLHAFQTQLLLYEKLVSLMEAGDADAAAQLLDYLIRDDATTLLPLLR